jgi:hypothetical protein
VRRFILLVMMETVSEFDLKYHSYLVTSRMDHHRIIYHRIYFRIISPLWALEIRLLVSMELLICYYFTYVFVDFLSGKYYDRCMFFVIVAIQNIKSSKIYKSTAQLNQAISASKGKL